MTDKNLENVIGEDSNKYKDVKVSEKKLVSYWNLIRSYILLHYSDKIVVFFAKGLGDNSDFLHYASINIFENEENMKEWCDKIKNEYEDLVLIKSINGEILD